VHVVARRGENEFHGYRYATMGDILKEITPLLGRHGIVIFQSETGRAMFDDDNVIAVEYAFTVAHASGETWPHALRQTGVSTCRNSKGGWDDKSLNKCHTAARKYFLLSLFQIPTGEEDDADQGDRRPAPAQVPAIVHRVRSVAPEYVVPPPSRALKPGGIAERAITKRYEQAIRSAGPSQPFVASEAGKAFSPRFQAQAGGYDERNPPPHDAVPDHAAKAAAALNARLHPMHDELPGDLAPPKQLDHTERDGVPGFLDRRKANGAEPTFVDLVEG
jgi:ERF superfamily